MLGVASLNYSGYVREKALKLMSGIPDATALPYILLSLNDWVKTIRKLAEHILRNTLTVENIDFYIDHYYLVNKLEHVQRTNLKNTRNEIIDYLKKDAFKDKIKNRLTDPYVKTRLFCYGLLKERIRTEEDIIHKAIADKSFEVRLWLLDAMKILEPSQQNTIIEKLL